MPDHTNPARESGPGQRSCAAADCASGQRPPDSYDTCEDCAATALVEHEQQRLHAQVAEREARLANRTQPRHRPLLAALLERFGPGARLGMAAVHGLRPGDVFAWPCAQIRSVTEADRRGYGQRTFEVVYTHDADEPLPAYEVHLVLRPGDTQVPCGGCGRTFIDGCVDACHDRFITEDEVRAVFAEAGMAALTEPDGA
ncbi:hypothetical protein K3N28_05780 [Glycomyces sp. TRM65418]|uniref:hypothetical protein n=1 Tax=Glycomyces sp. TRM65418 TaxID=2867006 RepID=UPI001CE5CE15|nr:hypothetical protein [Glycomyces sp. TRM65418]MCC3762578.1 hypothetical protein [Glycomyces sp. TRM65418]QZD56617.1 hypothetical protein K3N28_05740 [Glycomyces sp. TRM65418]